MVVLVVFHQLDINLDIFWKREPLLQQKCLDEIGLWAILCDVVMIND